MITEDYVSFEIAKLLKEKGFNEACYTNYVDDKIINYDYVSTNFELIEGVISAPTLQMAMKWLREKCNIIINVWYSNPNWAAQYLETRTHSGTPAFFLIGENYKTYEEGVKAAIKYCLTNLI